MFDRTEAFPVSGAQPSTGLLPTLGRAAAGVLTLDTGTDYVKRIVGLPGDRVTCCDGTGRCRSTGSGWTSRTSCRVTSRAT